MSDDAPWNDPDPFHIIAALRSGEISADIDPRRTPLINAYIRQVKDIFESEDRKLAEARQHKPSE